MSDLARPDPAASAYGDLMRAKRSGVDPIARESERVRALLAATRDLDTEREARRAYMRRFTL